MAIVTITLKHDARGNRQISLDLQSEGDTLPHEHEEDHRRILEEALGELKDSDTITVTRGRGGVRALPQAQQEATQQRQVVEQKG